ncbi:hypothetical protein AGABI1DRAFT_44318 [Agaricus bisporus var. burnettii JB137-S8]|uniref:Thioesterase domain-containing protein n=1 Tax=Agaricus bisporus var. burnettii (strain JB137-S8 / ATCC MYA-4627 / FGSC 10392) TaxID=597362 RepID=K5VQS4_AGABU|nr:uncharacterized protein AGABI1DRAFT_44318 [Agaricus bisporus var. burnettii JB137-S8]EKM76824.1 hypothetical protein AGABI1DRAFT_44318 [Agaricus bisporus var. burnettii JB137-S8]
MSTQIITSRPSILAVNELILRNLRAVIRTVPAITKWLAILLFLINFRSWPLMWHFRVFKPVLLIQARLQLLKWRTMLLSKEAQDKRVDKWLDENLTPIGEDPLEMRYLPGNGFVAIDECDYNGHLSNSSYAKTLDNARFETALAMFPRFFGYGGRVALGGTHFTYLREIPMLAQYEVRTTVAAWNQKWLFIVHRFVSKPKSKKSKKDVDSRAKQAETPGEPMKNTIMPAIATPLDAMNTPFSSTPVNASTQETSAALKAAAASLASSKEPDGATLHTIAVSEVCFKIGRITVPPSLVLATHGFSAPPSEFGSSLASYSTANPPPHWAKVKALLSLPFGGSPKTLRTFLSGGWRDIPESDKWWDQALSGVVEQKRKARLEVVSGLKSGMEGAQALTSM